MPHPKHNRAFLGRLLHATQPNQQCQSSKGEIGWVRYRDQSNEIGSEKKVKEKK